MGWIWDAIKGAVRALIDWVIKPVLEWIANAVDWLVAELRALRHDLIKAIAKWLENDFAFLLAVIGAIALAVYLPAILKALKKIGSLLLNSAIVLTIKAGLVKIIDVNKLIDLVFLNAVLKIIWPDYLAVVSDFAMSVSALAEELGEGSGYIHAYFAAQRGIVYGTNALIGNPPELAEMAAYNETADFLKKIDDRFRRYAHDPGLIVKDFLEEVLIPAAEEQRDAQQALVDDVRENYERVITQEEGLKLVQDSVNNLIEEMPDEIAEQILKRWTPINNKINKWTEYIDNELRPKINGIILAAEERAAYQDQVNAYARENQDDLLYPLLTYQMGDKEEQEALRLHNLDLIGQAWTEEMAIDSKPIKRALDKTFTLIRDLARSLPGPKILSFEPAGIVSIPRGAKSVYDSWFIGEY